MVGRRGRLTHSLALSAQIYVLTGALLVGRQKVQTEALLVGRHCLLSSVSAAALKSDLP